MIACKTFAAFERGSERRPRAPKALLAGFDDRHPDPDQDDRDFNARECGQVGAEHVFSVVRGRHLDLGG